MPVTKQNSNSKVAEQKKCSCSSGGCQCGEEKKSCGEKCSTMPHHHCCGSFGKKLLFTLAGILLVYIIVLVGTMVRNNIQKYYYIGWADKQERTIMVQGQGKVTAKPDIAVINMGMTSEAATVAEAQKKNTEVMNSLVTKLKDLGVDSADIQTTNYNIYPQYDYTQDKGQVLKGYQVNQSLTVKIRNLEKANDVLALAGQVGANNVSGIQFTFDDREVYKAQARDLALKQVAEKAKSLSTSLGVKLISVVSYDEYENNGSYPIYKNLSDSSGMGGGTPVAAPQIEVGANDVILNTNVTFEIQ